LQATCLATELAFTHKIITAKHIEKQRTDERRHMHDPFIGASCNMEPEGLKCYIKSMLHNKYQYLSMPFQISCFVHDCDMKTHPILTELMSTEKEFADTEIKFATERADTIQQVGYSKWVQQQSKLPNIPEPSLYGLHLDIIEAFDPGHAKKNFKKLYISISKKLEHSDAHQFTLVGNLMHTATSHDEAIKIWTTGYENYYNHVVGKHDACTRDCPKKPAIIDLSN
jgi:hypothetical protein